MRRPACAPPPKIWISGSGSVTGASPGEVAPQRQSARGRGRVRDRERHRDRRVAAEPSPCSACRRARSARASTPAWSAASRPASAAAIGAVDVGRAPACTSRPPSARPPSRRSIASREPRDAPAGAIARPRGAAGERDLGLDRRPPARIPDAAAADAGDRRCSSLRSFAPAARDRGEAVHGLQRAASRAKRADRVPVASAVRYSTGDLPSTRASISAGQQRRGARVERRPRLPARRARRRPRPARRTRRA